MSKIDLSEKIERLEAFEERHAVRIEGASAWFEYNELSVLSELHPRTGTTIGKDLKVVAAAYNSKGQIIAKGEEYCMAESFWGFAVCECYVGEIPLKEISKIKLYPTALR